jgi:hypothetical protein
MQNPYSKSINDIKNILSKIWTNGRTVYFPYKEIEDVFTRIASKNSRFTKYVTVEDFNSFIGELFDNKDKIP